MNFTSMFNKKKIGLVNPNLIGKSKYLYSTVVHSAAGNTGNSYIGQYLFDIFQERQETITLQNNIFFDATPSKKELNDLDFIVFSFQDFLKNSLSYFTNNDPFMEWKDLIRSSSATPVVIGLGINSHDGNLPTNILPSLVELLREIDKKCGLICTRCDLTSSYLKELGINCVVSTGCPSYFAYDNDSILLKKVYELNNLENHNSEIAINGIFWSSEFTKETINPVLQDEPGFLRLLENEESLSINDIIYNLDMSHGYTKMILDSIERKKISIHPHLRSAGSTYQRCKFSIGTRVHGAIASINSGTPSIITNNDLRSKSLCDFFHLPHLPEFGFSNPSNHFGKDLTIRQIQEILIQYDWKSILKIRRNKAKIFKKALNSIGIKVSILSKITFHDMNLVQERLNEIDLSNSNAINFLVKNLKN